MKGRQACGHLCSVPSRPKPARAASSSHPLPEMKPFEAAGEGGGAAPESRTGWTIMYRLLLDFRGAAWLASC